MRNLLEAYATRERIAAADPADLCDVVVKKARARRHAKRMDELQVLAAHSAGLVDDTAPIVAAQGWLLSQLRLVDDQIVIVEKAIGTALESWPVSDRTILLSLPGVTELRQAVVLSAVGDVAGFHSDRQLRKLLGWYPEAKESGTSVCTDLARAVIALRDARSGSGSCS